MKMKMKSVKTGIMFRMIVTPYASDTIRNDAEHIPTKSTSIYRLLGKEVSLIRCTTTDAETRAFKPLGPTP